jgi:hypothetical protein
MLTSNNISDDDLGSQCETCVAKFVGSRSQGKCDLLVVGSFNHMIHHLNRHVDSFV